jgi:glycosyltransferase involved in cell wall biosynthesis
MGIQAANEGLLGAMAMHSGVERLYCVAETSDVGPAFDAAVQGFNPAMATSFIATNEAEQIAPLGTLFLPGPGLSAYAWMRRRVGPRAFSLCGMTHTTATTTALDALADLWTAPVEPWDAVICTSQAVRAMVTGVLEEQLDYLRSRFGGAAPAWPQLPIIPLGVDAGSFADDPALRASWRSKLGIADDEAALLFMGRLNPLAKAHPIPLFLAAALATRQTAVPLHLILAGWFASPDLEAAYRDAAEQVCPEVRVTVVDARPAGPRAGVWRAADIFVSPVDNVQESFGLTPVEAMAAGLPVVASDWDGYRDTVRHGVDGLLARTLAPAQAGPELARDYGARTLDYDGYLGVSSQAVAVDVGELARSIAALADDAGLRARMGQAGRFRVQETFDWRRIVPRYQELWSELAGIRAAAAEPSSGPNPARPDPFSAFAAYPSAAIGPDTRLTVGPTSPEMIAALLDSPLVAFVRPALPSPDVLAALVARAEQGPLTARQLIAPDEAPYMWRGIAWLLKYGLLAAV